ncbi:MAG: site-2 protease family protein [Clostridia bacterium]|nr:site-2 protease family protein [Clostridia bacterium]
MDKIKISLPALAITVFSASFYDVRFLAAAIAAAIIHEGGHLAVLKLGKCSVTEIYIGLCGAKIEYICPRQKSYLFDVLAAAAGPLFNAAALFLSVCLLSPGSLSAVYGVGFNAIFAVFNLLPAPPLDGGRILSALISRRFGPDTAEKAERICTLCCGATLAAAGLALWLCRGGNGTLFAASAVILAELPRKKLYRNPFKSYYK